MLASDDVGFFFGKHELLVEIVAIEIAGEGCSDFTLRPLKLLKLFGHLIEHSVELCTLSSHLCRIMEKMEVALLRVADEKRLLDRGPVDIGAGHAAAAKRFKGVAFFFNQ